MLKALGGLAIAMTAVATVSSGPAAAATQQVHGHATLAQPYLNNPNATDWLGSYDVGGTARFTALFGYLAPDTDEQYQPGSALTTKWGTNLTPDELAGLSSLLFRYGGSTSNDAHAALAHIVNSLTAAPQNPNQLDPANDFRHIAYDIPFHLSRLPGSAQALVATMTTEMHTYAGPWEVEITEPAGPHVLGQAAPWTFRVVSATGNAVPGVELTVTVTGGSLPGGGSGPTAFQTPLDGSPLPLDIMPTAAAFEVDAAATSPAAAPTMLQAVDLDVARLVAPVPEPIGDQVGAVAQPAGIMILPPSASVTLGESQGYTVQTVDFGGLPVDDVTGAAALSIAPDGSCSGSTCTPADTGAHTVTARFGDFTATAELAVAAVPTTTSTTVVTTTEPTTTQPPASSSTTVAPAPPTTTPPTSPAPGVLPETGGRTAPIGVAGLLILAAGGSLLALSRRRRVTG